MTRVSCAFYTSDTRYNKYDEYRVNMVDKRPYPVTLVILNTVPLATFGYLEVCWLLIRLFRISLATNLVTLNAAGYKFGHIRHTSHVVMHYQLILVWMI